MGVLAGIPVEEYLHSTFPGVDREYRDGTLVERSMPDYLHGKTQALLIALFMVLRKSLSLYPCAETRMMLRAGRFLIPDAAVFHLHEPGLVPDTPPLIAIDILSPDDRLTEVREKLEEYRAWAWRTSGWSIRIRGGFIAVTKDCVKCRASQSANWLLT